MLRHAVAASLLAMTAGCFSTHAEGHGAVPEPDALPVQDASDPAPRVDAGSGTPSSDATVPDQDCIGPIHDACTQMVWGWTTLLEAKDVGPGARLVATDGRAVLADLGDGTDVVVLLADGNITHTLAVPGPGRAVDVADGRQWGEQLWVLSCDPIAADGNGCSLLRAASDDAAFVPAAGSNMPPMAQAGVAIDPHGGQARPCVFATGVYCFDGAWSTELAPGPGHAITALAFEETIFDGEWGRALAVTQDGSYFTRASLGSIAEPSRWSTPPAVEGSIAGGTVTQDGFVLFGPDRLWRITENEEQACQLELELGAVFTSTALEGGSYVTAEGRLLVRDADRGGVCAVEGIDGMGPVLDTTTATCGASPNSRFLTVQRLIGVDGCIATP